MDTSIDLAESDVKMLRQMIVKNEMVCFNDEYFKVESCANVLNSLAQNVLSKID